eukprot:980540-Rhodomonas_salina.3
MKPRAFVKGGVYECLILETVGMRAREERAGVGRTRETKHVGRKVLKLIVPKPGLKHWTGQGPNRRPIRTTPKRKERGENAC